jgi:hypothetical protein
MSSSNGSLLRNLGIFVLALVFVGILPTLASLFPTASNEGYQPTQPIPYSHKLHAGQYKIDCKYCHVGVEKGPHATIPPVATCMNCHRVVKTDSPYIQKIKEAYESGKPIEWVRIHELPDHARFNHRPHVAKGVACQTCHGPIQDMEVVYQAKPLTMGWCLECHRGQTTPREILEKVHPTDADARGKPVAPFDCATCHY